MLRPPFGEQLVETGRPHGSPRRLAIFDSATHWFHTQRHAAETRTLYVNRA